MSKRKYMVIGFLALCITATLFIGTTTSPSTTSLQPYDPWCDMNDDGSINIIDIVIVALSFDTEGEPFAAKAGLEYDSGWLDITDKAGKYFNITHNLNSTDVMVDITGKTTLDGGVHQRHLGGTGYTSGWSRTYEEGTAASSVIQTSDGGYALAGAGGGRPGYWPDDALLVKTDAAGNMLWRKCYGLDTGTDYESAYSVIQTSDGGYALAGYKRNYGAGIASFFMVKTDVELGLAWTDSTADTITLYRGATDAYWNYVRVRIWKIKESP